jgi:amidase
MIRDTTSALAGAVAGRSEAPLRPFGATFTGRAWSEPTLLRLAYAFEQATQARRLPPNLPPLDPGCPS